MNSMNINSHKIHPNTFAGFTRNSFSGNTPVNISDVILTKSPEKKEPEKKHADKSLIAKISAITGGGILLVGLGAVYAIKSKKFDKVLEQLTKSLKDINTKDTLSIIDKARKVVYTQTANAIKSVVNISSNMSIAKDVMIASAMKNAGSQHAFLPKFVKKTTKLFTDLAVWSVKKRYQGVQKQFNRVDIIAEQFAKSLEKGYLDVKTESGKSVRVYLNSIGVDGKKRAEEIRNICSQIKGTVNNFVDDYHKTRISDIDKGLDQVTANFRDDYLTRGQQVVNAESIKGKFSKAGEVVISEAQSIKADDCLKELHDRLKLNLLNQKELISRSTKDNERRAKHLFVQAEKLINRNDLHTGKSSSELNRKFRSIEDKLNRYAIGDTDGGHTVDEARSYYKKELRSDINRLIEEIKAGNQDTDAVRKTCNCLDRAVQWLECDEKGQIQNLRDVLKIKSPVQTDDFKESQNLLKASNRALYGNLSIEIEALERKLNSACEFESENLLERLRDIKFGAAPAEVVGTILPIPIVFGAIANEKTKEDKVSTAIHSGIPVLGGMATWAYAGILKLLSNPKSMGLSLLTGIALSGITDPIDKKFNPEKYEKANRVIYRS